MTICHFLPQIHKIPNLSVPIYFGPVQFVNIMDKLALGHKFDFGQIGRPSKLAAGGPTFIRQNIGSRRLNVTASPL